MGEHQLYVLGIESNTGNPYVEKFYAVGDVPYGPFLDVTISSDGKSFYFIKDSNTSSPVSIWCYTFEIVHDTFRVWDTEQTIWTNTNAEVSLCLSVDDKFAYVASYTNKRIDCYSRNTETGVLTARSFHTDQSDPYFSPYRMTVSRDSRFLYIYTLSGRFYCFSIDPDSGALTFVESYLEWNITSQISPDNEYLYRIPNNSSGTIIWYKRNMESSPSYCQRDENY